MAVSIREIVRSKLAAVVAENSLMPFPETLDDDDLLETFGLDSVAFTSLLTQLEEAIGFIPEAILEGEAYPETFGELVQAYER